jgi:hypothetical protein
MKTALRFAILFICALVGLWTLGHGIALVVVIRAPGHPDVLRLLFEGSARIAAGICVLSVAVEQFDCWRTHRKDDSLL